MYVNESHMKRNSFSFVIMRKHLYSEKLVVMLSKPFPSQTYHTLGGGTKFILFHVMTEVSSPAIFAVSQLHFVTRFHRSSWCVINVRRYKNAAHVPHNATSNVGLVRKQAPNPKNQKTLLRKSDRLEWIKNREKFNFICFEFLSFAVSI